MIVLVARYHVQPGKGDAVQRELERMAPLVREREPGCALYQACRQLEDPDEFLLYEQYVDEAAVEAHRETEHFRDIIEGTVVPMLAGRERELYRLAVS